MKKTLALIFVVIFAFSTMSIAAYAEEASEITVTVNETVFVFDADTTETFRNKFIAHYFECEDDGTVAYGLTCTLFGHNLESSVVTAITHKASATAPRCLRETFDVETCSRCDYTNSTLIDATYIYCC